MEEQNNKDGGQMPEDVNQFAAGITQVKPVKKSLLHKISFDQTIDERLQHMFNAISDLEIK